MVVWLVEQGVRGSNQGFVATISEIGYLLLPCCDMTEILQFRKKERHKSSQTNQLVYTLLVATCILYNYRLLMRSTHDHEDRVRYWLTDAEGGGQPIPDKVFMVMSRPKSKVYYCFIKLSGIFLHKD